MNISPMIPNPKGWRPRKIEEHDPETLFEVPAYSPDPAPKRLCHWVGSNGKICGTRLNSLNLDTLCLVHQDMAAKLELPKVKQPKLRGHYLTETRSTLESFKDEYAEKARRA